MGKYCMVKIAIAAVIIHYFFAAVFGVMIMVTAAIFLLLAGECIQWYHLPCAGTCKCHARQSAACLETGISCDTLVLHACYMQFSRVHYLQFSLTGLLV